MFRSKTIIQATEEQRQEAHNTRLAVEEYQRIQAHIDIARRVDEQEGFFQTHSVLDAVREIYIYG